MKLPRHQLVLVACAIAAMVFSFIIWRVIYNESSVLDLNDMLIIATALLLVMGLFVFSALVFSNRENYWVFSAFLLPFFAAVGIDWLFIAVAIAAILLFAYGVFWIRSVAQTRLKISFWPFAFWGAPVMLTAVALLFGCAAYVYPLKPSTLALPDAAFKYVTPLAEAFMTNNVPYYQKDMTVDEFFTAYVEENIQSIGNVPQTAQVRALLAAEMQKQKDAFADQFGIKLAGSERFADIIPLAANSYINRIFVDYRDYIPAAVAIFVFLAVKSLGIVVNRLAVGVAWLIAQALIGAGLAQKEKLPAEREVLVV